MIKLTVQFFKQANKPETKNSINHSEDASMQNCKPAAAHIFSAPDLWNIQRRGKPIRQRRWSF